MSPNLFAKMCGYAALALTVLNLPIDAQFVGGTSHDVREIVSLAKQSGKREVIIATSVRPNWLAAVSLEQVLQTEVPLLVRIDQKIGSISDDGLLIETWYRASVVELFGKSKLPIPDAPPSGLNIPSELVSGPPDSILIRNSGGTVTYSGVKARMPEVPIGLELGKEYLLFVRFGENAMGNPTRVAQLVMGSSAVFEYDRKTEHVESLSASPNDPFRQILSNLTDGSIQRFRNAVGNISNTR